MRQQHMGYTRCYETWKKEVFKKYIWEKKEKNMGQRFSLREESVKVRVMAGKKSRKNSRSLFFSLWSKEKKLTCLRYKYLLL